MKGPKKIRRRSGFRDPVWLARVAEVCGPVGDPGLEASFETRVEEQALNLSQGLADARRSGREPGAVYERRPGRPLERRGDRACCR
jgi:hypothetical protein